MSEEPRNRKLAMVIFGVPIVVLVLMATSVFLIMTRRPDPATAIVPAPAAPAAPKGLSLAGTEWQCLTIAGTAVKDPQPPTLAFGADGRASGFAGVNRYGGSWEAAAGTALKLGPMAATRMAGPPERMDLEQRFLAALEGVDAATVQGPTLALRRGATVTATFGKVLAGPGAATAK
jgi:heat shock protein HslJ